jgi:preprotein translocase subunit YajC
MCIACAIQSGEYLRTILQFLPIVLPVVVVYILRIRRNHAKRKTTIKTD